MLDIKPRDLAGVIGSASRHCCAWSSSPVLLSSFTLRFVGALETIRPRLLPNVGQAFGLLFFRSLASVLAILVFSCRAWRLLVR